MIAMRTKQVECIVFKRVGTEVSYLLLKRIPSKGDFWQPPCGGVEKEDDSLMDAVFREIKEEAGIEKSDVLEVIEGVHTFTMSSHYLTKEEMPPITEYVFGVEIGLDVEVDLTKNIYVEHEEFKWVEYEQALELLKWEDNKTALRKLHALLKT